MNYLEATTLIFNYRNAIEAIDDLRLARGNATDQPEYAELARQRADAIRALLDALVEVDR